MPSDKITKARKASLYKFCEKNHSDLFKSVSLNYIEMKSNPAIQISKTGYGYIDLTSGKQINKAGTFASANAIDFLVRYLNYDFYSAVCELSKDEYQFSEKNKPHQFSIPSKLNYDDALVNYLTMKKISKDLINKLESDNLLYLSDNYGFDNIVFLNKEKNYGERVGTDLRNEFYRLLYGVSPSECWSFADIENYDTAYICTTALEAMSLYELNKRFNKIRNGLFVSIGNPQRIRAINKILLNEQIKEVVIASKCINDISNEKIYRRISPSKASWNNCLATI
ncbi:hypothetical protein [Schwartzia succinivorans]|jgi:hypothetical protein|uniref:Uncharacterized protein n=1 Tax=Schwartzia succinivorans DSM 10502 TaxID=1123243 RepID=A0A1M4W2Y2_9FIRM|nr:hypothetical protein [Schwartzia succinivorans]SHE75588.1 hypothetical protein SAMN02745190_01079 [Schwartzia succinivorans DSM 10502]